MKKPEEILPNMGLLLVEGADEKYFFIRACDAYGENNIQVMDFGGITDLPKFLESLQTHQRRLSKTILMLRTYIGHGKRTR